MVCNDYGYLGFTDKMEQIWLLQRIFNSDANPIVIKEGLYKIGRSPESNIFCKSEWVSRFHCDVTVRGGNVYIKDLGSLNGTFIEQTEILKERDLQLKDGDVISLGKPFLGGIPETGHYVYRLVACSAPQEVRNLKRKASSSPINEEFLKGNCSPKRKKEAEKQKEDFLLKQEDLISRQEVAESNQKRNAFPLPTSVSTSQVSSSDKDIECIDLTDDGSECVFTNKSSGCESVSNGGRTSPDSSNFKTPITLDLNVNSSDTNVKILQAVFKMLQNQESDKVLKSIEMISEGVDRKKENLSDNSSIDNQSIAGSRSSLKSHENQANTSNLNCEQIISANVSIASTDKSSSCQSVEIENYFLKETDVKTEAHIDVRSVQHVDSSVEQVVPCDNKELAHGCQYLMKDERKLHSNKPILIQPPNNQTHHPNITCSNICATGNPVQSDSKSLNNDATGKILNKAQNCKLLKKTRSDSFTSEMEKLDSLLKGLNENKGSNDSLNENVKATAESNINENEMKKIEGQTEILGFNKENIAITDNFKNFDKVTTYKGNDLLSKTNADMSLQKQDTADIYVKQQTLSEHDEVEVKKDSHSRNNPFKSLPLGAEDNLPIRIKQESSFEQYEMEEEQMVFSQDMDGVVVIDESEEELEYSQLFMEQDEVPKETSNEKKSMCTEEEFLYEIADDNEDMDLFQAHFSQCSQEQELIHAETPKKKKLKSQLPSSHCDALSKETKSAKSRGKDTRIQDVSVRLIRLDLEPYKKTLDGEVSDSNSKLEKPGYRDQKSAAGCLKSNEIINLNTIEKVVKDDVYLESFDQLKKDKSNEMVESAKDRNSSLLLEKTELIIEHSSKKSKTNSLKKDRKVGKKIGSRKVLTDINLAKSAGSKKDSVDTSNCKTVDLEKSLNRLTTSIATDPNEGDLSSNQINKDSIYPESNKQQELEETVHKKVILPPADSMTGAKLVKSTLLSKPTTVRKKPGRPKKAESSVTKESINKKQQKQMIENRKAKLKTLALEAKSKMTDRDKGNAQKEVTPRTEQVFPKRMMDEEKSSLLSMQLKGDELLGEKSVIGSGSLGETDNLSKSIGVAKITERNRSSILLEGLLEDPHRKTRNRKKIEKANSTVIGTKPVATGSTSCDKLKEQSASKADPVLPSSKVVPSGLKSCLKIPGQPSSNKKVAFDPKADVKLYECEGILRSVNAMGLKDKAPSTPIAKPLVTPATSSITSLEETFFDIVHWNASWVNEVKMIPGEPPVYVEKFNGKDAYVSYRDYKRWLYPLMMYELWGNMCKTMNDEDTNKNGRAFDGIVLESQPYGVHSSNGKHLLLLKCFFPLYGKQVQSMVEAMDILLIKALSACEGKRIYFVMFGLVYSAIKLKSYRDTSDPVARHYLTTLNREPDVCAYFDIIIYKSLKRQLTTGFQLRIRPTYNMMTEVREFESLIKLASSSLLHIIIDPVTNNSVYLQKDMNNKIVTQYPLNDEQRKAVLCTTQSVFANKPSISLIHGPPGTGKTQVIVSIVEQLLYRFKLKSNYKRKKILICSHSNTAIDEICLRLLDVRQQLPREKRFKLTRFGRKEKIHPRVLEIQTTTLARKEVEKRNLNEDFTLELSLKKATERMVATALENPDSPKVESYKKKYEQIQKRIASLEAIVNNKASASGNETRMKEIERMVFDEEMKVIYHSDIIATTLGSCAQRKITKAFSEMSRSGDEKREVGVCIIDEATQATEADSLLPLVYDVKNFILVGDPQQLPPFVASQTAKKLGLSQSLFSRLYKVWSGLPSAPVYLLSAQHRMHPEIARFPSKMFYDNQLTTPAFLEIKRPFKPYAIITHMLAQDSGEINLGEARLIVAMAEKFLLEPGMKGLSIGLIVPYQRQRSLILDLFVDKKLIKQLSVNTIDSYQGQEKDVILLSIVRTSGVGFLNDHQRLNVALTRARKAMYIVGNFTSLQTTDIWKELLSDASERNLKFDVGQGEKIEDIFRFLFERNNNKSRTSNT